MREKLTADLQLKFCNYIATGNYAKTACKAVGITAATLHSWLNQGEVANSGKYHDFYTAYHQAMAKAESEMVMVISESAKTMGDWRAAAWLLSHRHKKRWADKPLMKVESVAVATVAESAMNLAELTDDQLAKYEIFLNSLSADGAANDESKDD